MSVLDQVAGTVKSVVGEKAPADAVLGELMDYLHRPETGGLRGLIDRFESAGLAATVQSWMHGTKPLPIAPTDVTRVIGKAEVSHMAAKTGFTSTQVSEHLAALLPDAIGHLTPGGSIPSAETFTGLIGSLKNKFTNK